MNNKDIGEFIKRKRAEKGYSQYSLAEILYISREAVSKWERGVTIPDVLTLLRLSEIFEVTINEILIPQKFAKDDNPLEEANNLIEIDYNQ